MESEASCSGSETSAPLTGWERLRRFAGYTFAHHDDSDQLPPMPEELGDFASQTSMATFVGCVVGAARQYRREREAGPPRVPSSPQLSTAARSRIMAELQTMRLARIANSSLRGALAFGGMCGAYCGAALVSRVWHGERSVVDSALAGVSAGTLLGLHDWRRALGWRRRGALFARGQVLGLALGVPIGLVQESLLALLPDTVAEREAAVLAQTNAIVEGRIQTIPAAAAAAATTAAQPLPGGATLTDAVISQLEGSVRGSDWGKR